MRRLFQLAIVVLLGLFVTGAILFALPGVQSGVAAFNGSAAPTPSASAEPTSTTDVENRLRRVEDATEVLAATQDEHVAALTATIDHMRFILSGMALLLTVVVGAQAFFQSRQEHMQETNSAQASSAMASSVEQVSGVMAVIKDTLDNRLLAEKLSSAVAEEYRNQLDKMTTQVAGLAELRQSLVDSALAQRDEIESAAESLAGIARHKFRPLSDRLTEFARKFDGFLNRSEKILGVPTEFNGKVYFVRGIAAHYANDADTADKYLTMVTQLGLTDGEPRDTYQRRTANAHYFLGVAKSNFGDFQGAADSFREAEEPGSADFLTGVVRAEALAFNGRLDTARAEAQRIEAEINEQYADLRLRSIDLRLRGRAVLVQANVAILRGTLDYASEVRRLLEPVLEQDPEYFFVMVTLAQMHHVQGGSDLAAELFHKANALFIASDDLRTITEVRTRIQLQMMEGLCLRVGLGETGRADRLLDDAIELRRSLPTRRSQQCTVFSTLTKRNEKADTILEHIELIRGGTVLLPGRR